MTKLTSLTQEEQDNVIYDARFGDLGSLTEIFSTEVEPSVLRDIKDGYSKSTPFHMAAANGHLEVLKYLISLLQEEDVPSVLNTQNDSGNTALHWAVLNGHLDVVQLLCDNNADPFIRNKSDHDVFFEAGNNDQEKVEDYLLQRYGNIVENEVNEEETGKVEQNEDIKFSEGTEISKVTDEDKKAVEEMTEHTAKMNL